MVLFSSGGSVTDGRWTVKYKLIGLAGAALMLLTAAAAAALRPAGEKSGRVHQHLTARWDTGCGCDGSELCSHLPLVLIDTGGQEIPGERTNMFDSFGQDIYTTAEDGGPTIIAEVKVIDNGDRNDHPGDEPALTTESELRIRGQSSRRGEKAPYLLKFIDEAGMHRDLPVMGMAAHYEWALHSPLVDKSLVRNYLWYNISGEIMDYAPNCRFCEVILNGDYRGVYLMVETVTNGENCRLDLNMNVKDSEATGYLLRLDRPTEAELESIRDIYPYSERTGRVLQDFAIRYPGKRKLTEQTKSYIEAEYSAFEKSLYSYDYRDGRYGYSSWIDVDNFVDFYIIEEFAQQYDMGAYSTYLYKELGGPLRLCVWDLDNCLGNSRHTTDRTDQYLTHERAWYLMLFKDERFVQKVLERYRELRRSWLSEEFLLRYIDETLEYLGPAAERNNARWAEQIANWDVLGRGAEDPRSQEEAVAILKTRLIERGRWMDETIHSLQQYCHPSRNKKFDH